MKIRNLDNINVFMNTVDQAEGGVWLTSEYGDKYNLKSRLSQYIAIAALLGHDGDSLELWCDRKEDEQKFLKMFNEHPEIL